MGIQFKNENLAMVEGEGEKKRDCCSLDDLVGVVRLQNLQL